MVYLPCIGGVRLVNHSGTRLNVSYRLGGDRRVVTITNLGSHCLAPGWGGILSTTVTIAPDDAYKIRMYNYIPPFDEYRSFSTRGSTGLGISPDDANTIAYIRQDNIPPLGGPGDGPTRIIDRMKVRSLILGDHTETVIESYEPSEYSTTTNDTTTPFSAIFIDPITRVQVYGRSRDHAFYVSMLVMIDDDTYIIDQHRTPGLTLTVEEGIEGLFMLEANVDREWSIHTVIS